MLKTRRQKLIASRFLSPLIVGATLFSCCVLNSGSTLALESRDDVLAKKLAPLISAHQGKVSVSIRHLPSGKIFQYRADEAMPTASLIKLPMMLEAYRQISAGKLAEGDMITLREEDKVPGSGILTSHFSAGTQISLRDAIQLMMVYSDNTATNLVIDQIGIRSTAETMESIGFPNTKLHAKVFRRDTTVFPNRSKEFGLGSTTANEILSLLVAIEKQEVADEPSCLKMKSHLLACDDRSKIPLLIPVGIKIAHKTGSVSNVRCDAGIIYAENGPLAVAVLTNENKDRSWTDRNRANLLCAKIASLAFLHFNPSGPKQGEEDLPTSLAQGASGRLVEDLQRTLNARIFPSPELSVDGDFGPATTAAVKAFQNSKKFKDTGVVDASTWDALGNLVTKDPAVEEPAVVNSEVLLKKDADALMGVPFLTCKAWAIADAATGKVLWGNAQNVNLDIASTTKMMTAYLVLSYAKENPSVLDERVTFSSRADKTGGSTSAIRAGETLTVRELMYGLLLPSGNDASVAIAEHFGERLAAVYAGVNAGYQSGDKIDEVSAVSESDEHPLDPLDLFIDAMNRAAKSLGMSKTHFANPHGLTAKGHQSTATDLLVLARTSMEMDLFRQYVGTRQHGATVVGPSGYRRNLKWTNTNRLLAIDGFNGVKTGTTSAAGACLVSSAQRDGRELLMVVLGASSSDARYSDSRNLYRWAWRQLRELE